MLTSLIIAYFVLHGGGAAAFTSQLDQVASHIKKEITVEATKKQALAVVETAQKANKTFLDSRKKDAAALGKVLADRNATAAQLDAAMAPLLAADSVATAAMADMVFALKPVLGPSDWGKVFPPAVAPKHAKGN